MTLILLAPAFAKIAAWVVPCALLGALAGRKRRA